MTNIWVEQDTDDDWSPQAVDARDFDLIQAEAWVKLMGRKIVEHKWDQTQFVGDGESDD